MFKDMPQGETQYESEREQILALAGEPVGYLVHQINGMLDGHCIEGIYLTEAEADAACGLLGEFWSGTDKLFTADAILAARKDLEHENDQLARARDYHVLNAKAVYAECGELRQQLASAQAQIQQHRDAMEDAKRSFAWIKKHVGVATNDTLEGYAKGCVDSMHEALALPADTSALEALITKAGEEMRNIAIKECCKAVEEFPHAYSVLCRLDTAIRALPGVKLEDLQG